MPGSAAESQDDAQLIADLRQRDEDAFARIVDAWSPGMLRVARCHVASHATAEEVVQEAWIGVLQGLDAFEGRSKLKTWAIRIVINIAKSRGRRERRVTPFSSLSLDAGPTVDPDRFRPQGEPYAGGWRSFPPSWPPLPESEALSSETHAIIGSAVAALPEAQRIVIALRDLDGYEASEVCDALDLSEGNQRVLLHRARSSVRQKLEDHYTQFAAAPSGGS